MGATGVCMTDYHIYHGAFAVEPPVVLGHESAGTVAAVGEDVREFSVGERVAMNPVVPCNGCSACKRGATHLCAHNASIGGAGETVVDGAFAEYVRVPATNVEPVGDLPFRQAALAEPLACCVHGADRSGIEQGDSVAVVGAGPIGLLLLQTLRNRGAAPIAVAELDDDRRALAADLGADVTIDPTERDTVEAVREEVGPGEHRLLAGRAGGGDRRVTDRVIAGGSRSRERRLRQFCPRRRPLGTSHEEFSDRY